MDRKKLQGMSYAGEPIPVRRELVHSTIVRDVYTSTKLERGKLLKKSEDCNKNRHHACSSSHCICKCHRV